MNELKIKSAGWRILPLSLLVLVMLFATLVAAGVAFAGLSPGVSASNSPDPAAWGNGSALNMPLDTPTPTCPPGWTVYPNPAPPGESVLNAVTAIGPNDLWAVGYYTEGGMQHTLTVHGDGTNWTQVPSPNPAGSWGVLYAVAGVAPNDVWAVGSYNHGAWETLTMHWNGTAWSIVPSWNGIYNNYLYSVTAISSNDAWAVGSYGSAGYHLWPMILHWNGSSWSQMTSPSGATTRLNWVTAVSANDVWATGGFYTDVYGGFVIHWNGSTWSTVSSPSNNGTLHSLTALTANDIWAVGDSGTQTLIEHWNGTAWTVVPSQSPGATINHLYRVSALSPNNVWAVGDTDSEGGGTMMLAEHWDGTAWTQMPVPASPTGRDHLYGVEVTSGGAMWAVGTHGCTSGCTQNALIMRYGPVCTPTPTPTPCDPTWRTVNSPGTGIPYLNSVGVVSANDIWAVGYSINGPTQTLIEHWNGTSWSIVPSPGASRLYGVEVVSANDIWAVGYVSAQPATLHWNGTSWSIVPSPGSDSYLNAVAAVSANDVWAVGYSLAGGGYRTLIEHWNGTSWSIVPSPGEAHLTGVAAVSANDAWAVGYTGTFSTARTLIEHWDGTSWSIVPSPNPGLAYDILSGVAAVSANDVWAVGDYLYAGSGDSEQTLTLHWNGTSWSVVPSPSPGTTRLNGIEAVAANDIWAVGELWDGSGADRTLAEHWNGTSWSVVPSPNGHLYGVAAVSANDVWAVGNRQSTTFTTRYSGPCVTPTPTPGTCQIAFTDVHPDDYFYEAVRYLYCMGAISGYADGTFRPYNNTTRAQLCKIAVLAEGWPINTAGGPHFTDVPVDHNFYDYIETAYNRGIVTGYADGTFRPDNNIKRAQLCKVMVLAQQWPIDTSGGPHFFDVSVSHPFYGYIETAYNHEIITGYGDGTFRPDNSATRGQICKIVYEAISGP